jgi:hypothetical protein
MPLYKDVCRNCGGTFQRIPKEPDCKTVIDCDLWGCEGQADLYGTDIIKPFKIELNISLDKNGDCDTKVCIT